MFSRFESVNLSEELNDLMIIMEVEMKVKNMSMTSGKVMNLIDIYCSNLIKTNKQTIEPLEFWKNHQQKFSFLSKYARSILSIPATTTNVEKEFSTAG
jgi:hypothetical protein